MFTLGAKLNQFTAKLAIVALATASLVGIGLPTAANAAVGTDLTTTVSPSTVLPGGKVNLTTSMPQVSATDNSTQEIIQTIDPTMVQITGPSDVIAPTGWVTSFSKDGLTYTTDTSTWVAADWAAVKKVKAAGPLNSGGLTADGNQIVSRTIPIVEKGNTLTGSAGSGDGYDVRFDDRGYLFNTYHHGSPSMIDCRLRSTGARCGSAWPFGITSIAGTATGFITPGVASEFIDNINHHLWFPAANSSGSGFFCVDISNINAPAACGGSYSSGFHNVLPYSSYTLNVAHIEGANGMVFSWDINLGKIMCYNYVANNGLGAPCASALPVANRVPQLTGQSNTAPAGTGYLSAIYVHGYLVYGYIQDVAICIDSRTLGKCAGWAAGDYKFTSAQNGIYELPDAAGNILGVCFAPSGMCLNENGQVIDDNPGLNYAVSNYHSIANGSAGESYANNPSTVGSKVIFADFYTLHHLWCYDVAVVSTTAGANGRCAGWTPATNLSYVTVSSIYTSQQDPTNRNCIWTNGDNGTINSVDVTTGTFGCPQPPTRATFSGDMIVPRMTCDASAGILGWNSFTLSGVTRGTDYGHAFLTVLSTSGAPVVSGGTTWDHVPFGSSNTIDLSTINVADAGATPTFQVDFDTRSTTTTPVGKVSAISAPAQLCLALTAQANLPTTGYIFSSAAAKTALFSATGRTIAADGTTTVYNPANASLSIGASTGAAYGAIISGNTNNGLSGSANKVVPNAVVALLSSAGIQLNNPDGTPITVTSDASGNFSFGYVLAGTYKLGFKDIPGVADAQYSILVGGAATSVAAANVNFSADATLQSTSVTVAVGGATQTVNAAYWSPAKATNDTFNVAFNSNSSVPANSFLVTANDAPTTGSAWVLSTIKISTSATGPFATTAITNSAGTYSVNTATGAVIFAPTLGATTLPSVAPTIYYQITDNFGGVGGARSSVASVTATELAAPTVANDSVIGDLRSPIKVNVLDNDSAATGTTLDVASIKLCTLAKTPLTALATDCTGTSISSVVNTVTQGTYSVDALGNVTFTPANNWAGIASPVTYMVKDALGGLSFATVTSTVLAVAPVINTTALPNDLVNTTYSFTLSGSIGSAPLTATPWTVTGLPAGLTYNATNGVISGTSTQTGTFNVTVVYAATDGRRAVKTLPLSIGLAPTITDQVIAPATSTVVPNIILGTPFSFSNTVSAGTFPIPTTGSWSVVTGSLPVGITLNPDTGVISGTATTSCVGNPASGNFNVTIQVTDSVGNVDTHVLNMTVAIPMVINTSLSAGAVGTALSVANTTSQSGGVCNVAWGSVALNGAWSATGLPAGVTLDPNTGVMSGTPTVAGVFHPVISVMDTNGTIGTKTLDWTINAPPVVATGTLGTVGQGVAMTPISLSPTFGTAQTLFATNPWTVTGLPTGLSANASTGVISGTTSVAAGSYNVTVTVKDSLSLVSAVKTLTLVVVAPSAILTASPQQVTAGVAATPIAERYSMTAGAVLPLAGAWSATGLPAGMTIDPNTGAISGTPTTGGAFNATISMTDSLGVTVSKVIKFNVVAPPMIMSPATFPSLVAGTAVGTAPNLAMIVDVAPGTANLTGFALANGTTLPAGLQLNATTGAITGTPTLAGATGVTTTFSVTVTDANGLTSTKEFNIYVGVAPVFASNVTTAPAAAGTVQIPDAIPDATATALGTATVLASSITLVKGQPMTPYDQVTPEAVGGQYAGITKVTVTAPATIPSTGAWSSTALPAGLVMDPNTGIISGTPTSAGSFTVTLTDSKGLKATKTYTIALVTPPTITTANPATWINGTAITTFSQTKTDGTVTTAFATTPWNISPALPAGLLFNQTTGAITGTPTANVDADFTVTYKDSYGLTASKLEHIRVITPPTITTAVTSYTFANGVSIPVVNDTATGGSGTIPATGAWTISSGSLPAGFFMNADTGAIMGIPQTVATTNFTVQVTNSQGQTATKALTFKVVNPPVITTGDLGYIIIGSAVPQTAAYKLAATAGTGTIASTGTVWTVDPSTPLPAGVTLNAASGQLGGTPTVNGTFGIKFIVVDSNGVTANKLIQFPIYSGPTVTTQATVTIAAGVAIAPINLAATVGTYPIALTNAWSISSGTLPAGLTLNSNTGVISGSTTVPSTTVTVRVVDQFGLVATKAITIVTSLQPVITTSSLPVIAAGSTVAATNSVFDLAATASNGGTFATTGTVWSVDSTTPLPAGLILNPITGQISGTPTVVAGDYPVIFKVTDSNGVGARSITISIKVPAQISTPSALPIAAVGASVTDPLTSTTGSSPIPATGAWAITSGVLPTGLTLNPNTGLVSGTVDPTVAPGVYPFTVSLTDSAGLAASKPMTVEVAAPPTITSSANLASIGQNVSISPITLVATAGTKQLATSNEWSIVSGSLPAGLSLNATTGVIRGSTTSPVGTYTFTVRVVDNAGIATTKALTISVTPPPTVTTTSVSNIIQGAAIVSGPGYFIQATATSPAVIPTAGTVWTVDSASSLPSGLSLNAATGEISGTAIVHGTFSVTFDVVDSFGASGSGTVSFTILAHPTVTSPTNLPAVVAGSTITPIQLAAAAGDSPIATTNAWAITAGALPTGLTLNPTTGVISGTTTVAPGTFPITVTVTDTAGITDSKVVNVIVATAPSIDQGAGIEPPTYAPLANIGRAVAITPIQLTGTAGSSNLATSNGWAIIGGALPDGLTLNTTTGQITGTTTSPFGQYAIRVTLTDSVGLVAYRNFTISVKAPPQITSLNAALSGVKGAPFSFNLTGRAVAPSTLPRVGAWDVAGLPAGVTFNNTTGVISGTPTTASTGTLTVTLYDNDQLSSTQTIPFTIADKNQTALSLPVSLSGLSVPISPAPIDLTNSGSDTLSLPVTYGSDSPTTCYVDSSNQLFMVAAGPCIISATSGVGPTLSKVTRTVVIAKANQTITVPTGTELKALVVGNGTPALVSKSAITDNPLGFQVNASVTSGLPLAYSVDAPLTGDPSCAIDDAGNVTWLADLITQPVSDASKYCDVTINQPGDGGYNPATALHLHLGPASHDGQVQLPSGYTQPEPAVTKGLPRTGGVLSKGGVGFTVAIDPKKKTFTLKPFSNGMLIGPITANVTIQYQLNGVPQTQVCVVNTFGDFAKSDAPKDVSAVTGKYLKMPKYGTAKKPGWYDKKNFTNSLTCALNKDATNYFFVLNRPVTAVAHVTRDRRWPTTYLRTYPNGSPIIPKSVDWTLTVG